MLGGDFPYQRFTTMKKVTLKKAGFSGRFFFGAVRDVYFFVGDPWVQKNRGHEPGQRSVPMLPSVTDGNNRGKPIQQPTKSIKDTIDS